MKDRALIYGVVITTLFVVGCLTINVYFPAAAVLSYNPRGAQRGTPGVFDPVFMPSAARRRRISFSNLHRPGLLRRSSRRGKVPGSEEKAATAGCEVLRDPRRTLAESVDE